MNIQYFRASEEDHRFVAKLLSDRNFSQLYTGPQSVSDMREASQSILR
jgi:hypothetical protein